MAHWRIHTLPHPPPHVLDAAVAAASDLGFGISQLDEAGGHLYLSCPRSYGRRDAPVEVTVTDSGLGTTVLRVGWGSAATLLGPWSPTSRQAARFSRHCLAYLRSWHPG
jgi:hypothetical protein